MQNRKDQAIIALGLNVIQGAGTIKLFKRKRQMHNNMAEPLTLAAFTEEEKELLRTDLSYKKRINKLFKKARAESKRETCYYCGKPVSSFCNSHSIPKFCLKNIAVKGKVLTLNSILDNPLMDTQKGVKEAGTFHLICNDCDSKIFSDYENSENYKKMEKTINLVGGIGTTWGHTFHQEGRVYRGGCSHIKRLTDNQTDCLPLGRKE